MLRARSVSGWVLLLLLCGHAGFGQSARLSLKLTNASVQQVFEAVEKQSEFRFIYGDKVKNYTVEFNLELKDAGIEKVINEIARQSSLSFKKINNNIAVSLNEDVSSLKKIAGIVRDAKDSIPIAGAYVFIRGSGIGTATDKDGAFSLSVPAEQKVVAVSAAGYEEATVALGNHTAIEVSLSAGGSQKLDEVVVIGYGTQSNAKISGSVAKINADQLEQLPITSFEQGLAGQLPGVEIVQSSGAPGGDLQIRIRGISTITAGTKPLIVLDGLPLADNNTSNLNHADIASIEVLKDASAAAIYGSRGSNGVILITTKKDTPGKTVFNLEAYGGVQLVSNKIAMMDAYESAQVIAAARNNAWTDKNPGTNHATDPNNVRNDNKYNIPPFLFPYLEGQKGLVNTDWQDEVFRPAGMQNYNLSVAGGDKKVRYFISGNYLKQDGIVINSGMKRYAGRINLNADLTRRLSVGLNLSPTLTQYDLISEKTYKDDGIVLSALMALPFFSPYNADGSLKISEHINAGDYSTTWVENPVALAKLIDHGMERFKFFANSYVSYKFSDFLQYKLQVSAEWNTYTEDYFRPSALGTYRNAAPTPAVGTYYTNRAFNWIAENMLSYKRSFNNVHTIDAVLGYTAQRQDWERSYLSASNFPNNTVHTLNAGIISEGYTSRSEYSILSMLGRINYDYKAKYMLSVALRRDGSSRFGNNSKWGWFPAFSAAWRISKEPFFPRSNVVSELKLRASYGRTGNNQIPDYGAVALMESANYVLNNTVQTGLAAATAPNANLSWEKSDMMNTGIDIGLFRNKINLSAEYYYSITNDLLLNVPVPASSGYATSLQNIGKVKNEGYELTLSTNIGSSRSFRWNALFNYSSYRNTVLELGKGQQRIIGDYNITQVGEPIGAYYGYHVMGVFKNEADLAQYPHLSTSRIGDYIYEDVNKDGQITDADRKVLGSYLPDYSIGFRNTFSYKNFDLTILVQAVQGFEIYNLTRGFTAGVQGWSNALKEVYNGYYRSEEEPGSGIARPLTKPNDKNYEQSDYMIEDASFIRVRNISLSYTIPKRLLKRIGIDKMKVYVSAKNPFTFTRYSSYNPEVSSYKDPMTPGIDYGAYPLEKTFVFGVNLKF